MWRSPWETSSQAGSAVKGGENIQLIGEAANLAARLLALAGACEILASAEIWQATAHLVDYEALGGQIVKGLDDPVPVFRLKGLRESAAESRPLVGRRAELAQCRGALAAIADGQAGAVIVVRGEPGIGKTRFAEELQSIGAELGFARTWAGRSTSAWSEDEARSARSFAASSVCRATPPPARWMRRLQSRRSAKRRRRTTRSICAI
jgi:hypothetical protein